MKTYPTPTAMYTGIESGRLDAALDSFGSVSYAKERNGDEWQVVVPQPDDRGAASEKPAHVCFPIANSDDVHATS